MFNERLKLPKEEFTDNNREKDIHELCKQVRNSLLVKIPLTGGCEEIYCPLCQVEADCYCDRMEDFPHAPNCAYNIAKDLMTGIKIKEIK